MDRAVRAMSAMNRQSEAGGLGAEHAGDAPADRHENGQDPQDHGQPTHHRGDL
jgi:hypothetical protein